MKKNVFLVSALALLSLAACKKDEPQPEVPDRNEHIYTFEASAATKATLGESCVEWAEGDVIGTFAKGNQNAAGRVKVGTPCTFPVKTVGKLAAGEKVYAYAPYGENAATDAKTVAFEIPSEQVSDKISMPLAAQPYEVTEELADNTETPVAGMNFYNLASVAVLKLYATGDVAKGEKIQSIKLTSTADICGSYTLDLTAIDPANEETLALTKTSGVQTVTVTLPTPVELAATEDAAVSVPFVLAPGTYPLELTVVTDQASYIKTTSEDIEFIRNHRKALVLNIADAKPSGMVITPSELRSFGRGETLEYEIELTGVAANVTAVAPEGWTAVVDGTKLKVTASTDDSKALEGKVVVTAGKFTEEVEVRRSGLNSQDDLVEFTTSVDNMLNDGYKIDAKYLDGEEISINADIVIPDNKMAYGAYWLKRLQTPINGNNHTLTYKATHASRGGLIQNLGANVHDLVIDGTINATGKDAYVGGLACLLSKSGLTVSNVTSTVEITLTNTGCRMGGFIGAGDPSFSKPVNFNMKDCHFNGKLKTTANAYAVGGLIGDVSDNNVRWTFDNCDVHGTIEVAGSKVNSLGGLVGRGGAADNILTFNGCEFAGNLSYSLAGTELDLTRIGGFLGNLERGGIFSKCSFTGTMTADWNNVKVLNDPSHGFGGFVGRNTGHNDNAALNIKALFTDCVSKGTITVKNSADIESNNILRIGHLIGSSNNNNETTHVETGCTYESVITVNGKELTIKK